MLTAVFITDDDKTFTFKNVEKVSINKKDTIIGYFDDDSVYHEEIGPTPEKIVINKEE
jgi:hypothetical protein